MNFKMYYFFLLMFLFYNVSFGQCSEYDIINLKKIAIVFGEKDYKHAPPLNNTVNDALDISDSLKKIGYEVYTYQNTDLKTMNNAIDDWYSKLQKYDVALFFYSGHGAEVNGENFLFPIDANPKGPSDLYYSAYSANKLLARLDNSGVKYNIMVLDACRNNPFTKNWSRDIGKGGLAAMSGRGTFIGYAASPGMTASDGSNRNGTYTEGILKYITIPNLTIDQIFTKVNSYVRQTTSGSQIPFKNSSLSADFCFSVKREKIPKPYTSFSSFGQPAGSIKLSMDQEYVFSVDSAAGGLFIKDTRTLSNLALLLSQRRPWKLIAGHDENLYVLDSSKQAFIVIDWKKKIIKKEIKFDFQPSTFAINNEETKAFVGHKIGSGEGVIDVIELNDYRIIKTIPLESHPTEVLASSDNKSLFVTLNTFKASFLLQIDLKNYKTVQSFTSDASFGTLLITTDNKMIYLASSKGISILDVNSFKILKHLDSKANSFACSMDNKYLFATGESEIIVIRTADQEISNRLPFATKCKGLILSNDGSGFVWLPQENRIFLFEVGQQLENKLGFDPESNLKKFKEELKGNSSLNELSKARQLFEQIDRYFNETVDKLRQELGDSYTTIQTGYTFNFQELSFSNTYGIISAYDPNKKIWPTHKVTLTETELILTIKEDQKDKAEIFKIVINNIDGEAIKKFIRNYFLLRLDQLR